MTAALCYDLLYLIPLALALTTFSAEYLFVLPPGGTADPFAAASDAVPSNGPSMLIIVLISILAAIYIVLFKHFRLKGRAALLGFVVALSPVVLFLQPREQRLGYLKEHIWFFQIILLVLLGFLIYELGRHYRMLRFLILTAGVVLLAVYLFGRMRAPKAGCFAVFFLLILTAADEVEHRSRKEGDTDPGKHLTFIAPFLIVMFLPFVLIRTPEGPYRWDFVKKIAGAFQNGYVWVRETLLTKEEDFGDVSFIGFSDRGTLGGNITGSDRTVMHLSSRVESDPWIYLSGCTFDTFDGRSWEKRNTDAEFDLSFDTLETVSAVLDYKEDAPFTDLMKRSVLNVQYLKLNTDRIFLPLKTAPGTEYLYGSGADGTGETVIEGGDIRYLGADPKEASYQVVYYRMNRDAKIFEGMLREGHEVTEESWAAALEECGIVGNNRYRYAEYQAYRELVYSYYLPETVISQQLRSLLEEELEGAQSDYEKLLRIRSIMEDFTYTENPGDLPEEIDSAEEYLDYFIFEKQAGYCSYYATAFTLMARACGIPAAYVQGFHTPMGKYPEADVLSSSAHAWVMVYLDGIGWIIFEPTPGMARDVEWKLLESLPEEEEELSAEESVQNGKESASDPGEEATDNEVRRIRLKWYHILIPVSSGILFVLILYMIDSLIKKERYRRLALREKELWICKENLRLLERMGSALREGETLEEYRKRLERDRKEEVPDFFTIQEKLLYAGEEGSQEDLEILESYHTVIIRMFRKEQRERIRAIFRKKQESKGEKK